MTMTKTKSPYTAVNLFALIFFLNCWLKETAGFTFNIPEPVEPFVGRSDLLHQLFNMTNILQPQGDENLENSSPRTSSSKPKSYHAIVLHGPGGIGKRQLVFKFIQQLLPNNNKNNNETVPDQDLSQNSSVDRQKPPPTFQNFVWLDGRSQRTLQDSFVDLYNELYFEQRSSSSPIEEENQDEDEKPVQNSQVEESQPKNVEFSPVSRPRSRSALSSLEETVISVYRKLCTGASSLFVVDINLQTRASFNLNVSVFLDPFIPSDIGPDHDNNKKGADPPSAPSYHLPTLLILLHTNKSVEKLQTRNRVRLDASRFLRVGGWNESESVEFIIQRLHPLFQRKNQTENQEDNENQTTIEIFGSNSDSGKNMTEKAQILGKLLEGVPMALHQTLTYMQALKIKLEDAELVYQDVDHLQFEYTEDPREMYGGGMGMGYGGYPGDYGDYGDSKKKPKKPKTPLFLVNTLVKDALEGSTECDHCDWEDIDDSEYDRALDILEILAFLPVEQFRGISVSFLLEILGEGQYSSEEVMRALCLLEKFAMISTSIYYPSNHTHGGPCALTLTLETEQQKNQARIEMHRDTQKIILKRLKEGEKGRKHRKRRKGKKPDPNVAIGQETGEGFDPGDDMNPDMDMDMYQEDFSQDEQEGSETGQENKGAGEGELSNQRSNSESGSKNSVDKEKPTRKKRSSKRKQTSLKSHMEFLMQRCSQILDEIQNGSKIAENQRCQTLRNIELVIDKLEAFRPKDFDLLKILEFKARVAAQSDGWRALGLWAEIFTSVKKINGIQANKQVQTRIKGLFSVLETDSDINTNDNLRLFLPKVKKVAFDVLSQSPRFTAEILQNLGLKPRDTKSPRDEL